MRFSKRHIVMASALLASTFAWGQQPQINGPQINEPTSLLVRMSVASSWEPSGFGSFPQICFSVDRSGHYEMRRATMKGNAEFVEGTPHTELLQGTMPVKELKKLETLLQDPEFRALPRSSGGILRKGAETFVAEVPRRNGVQRVVISDTDGENPFPHSAQRTVDWLQQFKAEGAEPLDVSALDICPSGALQPVNPNTASLQPVPSSGTCVTR
jgi:hypothetical protein